MYEQLLASFGGQDRLTCIEENIHSEILASAATQRGDRLVLKSNNWPAWIATTSNTTKAAATPTYAKSLLRSRTN